MDVSNYGITKCDAVKKFLETQCNRENVIRKGEDGKPKWDERDFSSLPNVVAGSSSKV
ncbi:MAG: hypothetical protein ACR5K2_00285 [Wolbachia sp.]